MAGLNRLPHRPDLQGLRAIAILLVLLAHAGVASFAGGFVGVDVFFVLSGYLITGILLREYNQTGGLLFSRFIARRLKRLFPALATVLVTVLVLAPLFLSTYEFAEQTASFAYAITWTSNFYFSFTSLDYFAELQARDLFLHTWSLGVEEQFYIIWPALLLVILELSAWRKIRNKRVTIYVFFGMLFVASLGLSLYWSTNQSLWSFYLMPSRIWQFTLGAMVLLWTEYHNARIPGILVGLRVPLNIVGLILVGGSALIIHPDMTYPGYWALLPSLGAALIIATGGSRLNSNSKEFLSHPVLVWIGDRSYSLYLWHWPVFMFGYSWAAQSPVPGTAILVAVSLVLATLSYRYVELPFWKGAWSNMRSAYTVSGACLVMLLAVISSPKNPESIELESLPGKLPISISARQDKPSFYARNCDSWFLGSEVQPCVYNSPTAKKTVVLIGDSVGVQWFSLVPGIFHSPEWRVMLLTKSSCPIVDEDFFYSRIGRQFAVCRQWRDKAIDYLVKLQPDVIFLGSDTTYNFSESQWINGSVRILDRLSKISSTIIIIPGTPALPIEGPSCLEKAGIAGISKCRFKLPLHSHTERVAHYLERTASRYKNVHLLDLTPLVCPNGYCSARTADGTIVFRDRKHLTDSFVITQIPVVTRKLTELGIMTYGK